jgi:predicted DNA binding protein
MAAGESGHDLFVSSHPDTVRRATRRSDFRSLRFAVRSAIHSFARPSLREFPITETELKLIAAAAIMGLSNSPKNG